MGNQYTISFSPVESNIIITVKYELYDNAIRNHSWISLPSDYDILEVWVNNQACFIESLRKEYRSQIYSAIENAHSCPIHS